MIPGAKRMTPDLDYEAMSNATTWPVGRLQTRQDRARVPDGLATAGVDTADPGVAVPAERGAAGQGGVAGSDRAGGMREGPDGAVVVDTRDVRSLAWALLWVGTGGKP